MLLVVETFSVPCHPKSFLAEPPTEQRGGKTEGQLLAEHLGGKGRRGREGEEREGREGGGKAILLLDLSPN